MSLAKATRDEVIRFVLRDLVPVPRWNGKPLDWFLSQFAFVDDQKLQNHLAEAYYQARLAEKLRTALALKGGFNNTFIKTQVILYASIYEAIIDHFLERSAGEAAVREILESIFYSPAIEAFGKNTFLVLDTPTVQEHLVPCRKKKRVQKLKEIQFKKRLAAARDIGLVRNDQVEMIERLYTSRNRVHLAQSCHRRFRTQRTAIIRGVSKPSALSFSCCILGKRSKLQTGILIQRNVS